jgi:hypothetical protein
LGEKILKAEQEKRSKRDEQNLVKRAKQIKNGKILSKSLGVGEV